MIEITFDLELGTAKTAGTATIKAGALVPVRVTFNTPPGTASAISLALGSDATPPVLLAYTDAWAQESATVWTATLDATDTRLVSYLNGKGATAVNAELALTLNGVAQVAPNFQVTVQPKIVTGPAVSEGGPLYYSEAQVDALLAGKAAAATTLSGYGISNGQVQVTYVADGDSRTAGTSGVSWFDALCSDAALVAKNCGVSGKTVAQIVAGYAATGAASMTVSGGHQYSPAVTGRKGVYFLWGATNDLGGGASAAAVLANLQSLYASAHADGYGKVVGFIETPRAPAPGAGWETGAETQRLALNALLRGLTLGLSNTPDVLIDLEQLFPSYSAFPDGIHIAAPQQLLLARYVRARLVGEIPSYQPYVALRWIGGTDTFHAGGAVQMTSFAALTDNQRLYNPTTHGILCPAPGWVRVSAAFLRTVAAVGDTWVLYIYSTPAGGSAAEKFRLVWRTDATGTGTYETVNATAEMEVSAGEVLDFRIDASGGVNNWTILQNNGFSSFTLRYLALE